MNVRFFSFALLALLVFSCKSFEDAAPTPRTSLVHFYGGTLNYEGVKAEVDADGGFIIVGNIRKTDFTSDVVLLKTDARGELLWQEIIPSGTASDLKVVTDGYLIAGDSIDYQPNPDQISELVNTRARLIKMLFNRTITLDLIKDSIVNVGEPSAPVYAHVDFHGNAITVDGTGKIILLGSYKTPEAGSLTKSILYGVDPTTFDETWVQRQSFLEERDYTNSRALYLTTTNNLLWASTSQEATQALTTGWLSVVYVGMGSTSTFKNNDKYGDNANDHYHTGVDMGRTASRYGVVGSYARVDKTNSNIYFVSVDDHGNVVGDATYFDGIDLALSDPNVSQTEDFGNAITGTSDGNYVIAASTLSIPGTGNGKKDILLIKVDAFGGLLWSHRLGGTGDEVPSSISETSDGGLLVCGTNTVNNLSTVFLMKTDSNGEITK